MLVKQLYTNAEKQQEGSNLQAGESTGTCGVMANHSRSITESVWRRWDSNHRPHRSKVVGASLTREQGTPWKGRKIYMYALTKPHGSCRGSNGSDMHKQSKNQNRDIKHPTA